MLRGRLEGNQTVRDPVRAAADLALLPKTPAAIHLRLGSELVVRVGNDLFELSPGLLQQVRRILACCCRQFVILLEPRLTQRQSQQIQH